MVVLNRIYTRTGDDGTTSLGSGDRQKYDLRVAAYGTLDEVNAVVVAARFAYRCRPRARRRAGAHPNDLFGVEADLPVGERPGRRALTVTDAQVGWLEGDRSAQRRACAAALIHPAGRQRGAHLHLARTVCRRGERLMVELNDKPGEGVTPAALKYVNRLSDFLFVASRHANDKGATDVLWVPGQNR
jgi:cob(I)alamin adenosyltransferase